MEYLEKLSHKMRRHLISIALVVGAMLLISGCSHKRYVPVVKYPYPTYSALNKILRGVYGDRYVYAGQGPNRFDCSGLTYFSYATMNLWLPRRAIDQSRVGKTVQLSELQYGDLIFFDTHGGDRCQVNHVGIYIGKGRFTHASSAKKRVVTSSIYKPFYKSRVVVCKRLIKSKTLAKKIGKKPNSMQKDVKEIPISQIKVDTIDNSKMVSPEYSNENLF